MYDPDYWKFSNEDGKLERCDMRQFKADLDAAINYQKECEEMGQGQYTATPWSVNRSSAYDNGRGFVVWGPSGAGFGSVCRTFREGITPSGRQTTEAEANAAFIVQAVNSHEKLVAALREAHTAATVPFGGNIKAEAARVVTIIEAALRLAEGETAAVGGIDNQTTFQAKLRDVILSNPLVKEIDLA